MIIYILIFAILMMKFVRMIIFNLHRIAIYTVRDLFNYIKNKGWTIWHGYGLDIYIGMFGHGKTLSASRYVLRQAKRYKLNVLSNIKLNGYPYTPLTNYKQIIDAPENTIILIDEVSTVFNARNWKDFNINLLFQILQCRKNKKMIVATAQRFAHVDKLLRDITHYVIDCNKYWRFQHIEYYDAWDYENCMNTRMIKRFNHDWNFIVNADYAAYDTSEIIDNAKRTDFVSNEEILERRGEVQFNELAVNKVSRKFKKRIIKGK